MTPSDKSAVTQRERLTDKRLQNLAPALPGKRHVIWDAVQPNFGVRVTDKGARSFVVVRRLPGQRNPETIVLGRYPRLSLADAREAAGKTIAVLDRGQRPKEVAEAKRQEEADRRRDTFGSVAESYIKDHVARLRHAAEMEQIIRREFLGQRYADGQWVNDPAHRNHWRDKPVLDVGPKDVASVIRAIKNRGEQVVGRRKRTSGGTWSAHHALSALKTLFSWCVAQQVYRLEQSPCERIRPKLLIGKKVARQRTLNDGELFLVWRAAKKLGHPYGTLLRLLLLTGARLNEISGARWAEIDLHRDLLTVPATRMKMGAAHTVPLAPTAVSLLASTPRFLGGAYPISTTAGQRPFSGFSKAKVRLDRAIERTRVALARLAHRRGDEAPMPEPMPQFTLHDLRRTVRTGLSSIGVLPEVAELVIAHAQPGLHKTYNLHSFDDEKRDALNRWERHLLTLVEPPPRPRRSASRDWLDLLDTGTAANAIAA